jgi:hypothetical protein
MPPDACPIHWLSGQWCPRDFACLTARTQADAAARELSAEWPSWSRRHGLRATGAIVVSAFAARRRAARRLAASA